MKKFLFLFCAVICFISCSNNLPEFTEIKNVRMLCDILGIGVRRFDKIKHTELLNQISKDKGYEMIVDKKVGRLADNTRYYLRKVDENGEWKTSLLCLWKVI